MCLSKYSHFSSGHCAQKYEDLDCSSMVWISRKLDPGLWLDHRYLAANMILMTLVAGGLYWFFFQKKSKGVKLKYDERERSQKGRQFRFGNQVKDKAFWPMGNGSAPILLFAYNPV